MDLYRNLLKIEFKAIFLLLHPSQCVGWLGLKTDSFIHTGGSDPIGLFNRPELITQGRFFMPNSISILCGYPQIKDIKKGVHNCPPYIP